MHGEHREEAFFEFGEEEESEKQASDQETSDAETRNGSGSESGFEDEDEQMQD